MQSIRIHVTKKDYYSRNRQIFGPILDMVIKEREKLLVYLPACLCLKIPFFYLSVSKERLTQSLTLHAIYTNTRNKKDY